MDRVHFLAGEIKYVTIAVRSIDQEEVFSTRDATYRLYQDDVMIESGDCSVEEHELSVLVRAESPGFYRLEYTYSIAAETLKHKVLIEVV